jgi:phenylpropionate dioxygenase-like ring-hydroxylating dioxygenase large terminal subunit
MLVPTNYCKQITLFGSILVVGTSSFQFNAADHRHHVSSLSSTKLGTTTTKSILSPTFSTRLNVATSSSNLSIDNNSINSDAEATSSSQTSSFDNFDYNSCWHPVIWAQDLPLNKPTKVTLFDTDYVVARTSEEEGKDDTVAAMEDRCPHKSAALSEGRITSKGNFQCAYHGWQFNGKDGQCVEIPQVMASGANKGPQMIADRTCGTAIPAMVSQGMVWMFPGGNLESALLASPPPRIPEIDMEGFKMTSLVRDFPIDFSILLENIMDPDHGLFAHGAKGFDLYSASKDMPQTLEEEHTNNGKGWKITSRVRASETLLAFDKLRRGDTGKESDKKEDSVPPTATTVFHAPNLVFQCRRDEQGNTGFLTAFWICPVGTGRSRFMSASIAKSPISIPRWIMHIVINNFLDQDTHLLATQQKYVLSAEAKNVKELENSDLNKMSTKTRKNLYVYRSPTEKIASRVGAFWDATLNRAPKRVNTLLDMDQGGALQYVPSRRMTLDRNIQHTSICCDSQGAVRNCKRIQRTSKVVSLVLVAFKAWAIMVLDATGGTSMFASRLNRLLKPALLGWTIGLSTIASWLAKKVRREFDFKYTEDYRDKDLETIRKIWLD